MISFWLAAVLLALTAAVFVAVPVIRARSAATGDGTRPIGPESAVSRDEVNVELFKEQLQSLRTDNTVLDPAEQQLLTEDLERNLLLETRAAQAADVSEAGPAPWIAVVGVPVVALVAYLILGAYADQQLADDLRAAAGSPSQGQLERLALQLEDQPDNHDARYFLARAWMSVGEHARAAEILESMTRTFPQQASLKSQFAEALFLAAGQEIPPRVQMAIDAALAANPHDTMLYEIQGIAAWKAGDSKAAIAHFSSALRSTADPERRKLILGVMAQVTGTGHGLPGTGRDSAPVPAVTAAAPAAAAPDGPGAEVGEAATGRSISVLVEIDPAVEFSGNETVFVYARAAGGPRMPLAIQRLTPAALPVLVKLDSSMAMMPNMSLDAFDAVEVVARLSRSGSVTPGEGDVEALAGPLDLTAAVEVVKLRLGAAK